MSRNHYLVLGVSRTARPQEIRTAYRRQALERHPDRAGPNATEEFQQLVDAYGVLADPGRRAAYDAELRRLEEAPRRPAIHLRRNVPRASEAEPLVPPPMTWSRRSELGGLHDLIEDAFAELVRGLARRAMSMSERVGAIEVGVDLSRDEASKGAVVVVTVPVFGVCRACDGTGTDGWYSCPVCDREGVLAHDVPVQVRVPAKVADGTVLETYVGQYNALGLVLRTWIRIVD